MAAAAAKMLKRTRWTVLLSLNAAAILIAGIMIASAIGLNNGLQFQVVAERSDVVDGSIEQAEVLESAADGKEAIHDSTDEEISGSTVTRGWISSNAVPNGQLWNETAITIYQTADIDICVGGGLTNLGSMYWQTSNASVISGFYDGARTWLGYSSATCRYPVINGTGTTTITAGTYDGLRYDKLTVTVISVPVEQWKREVLTLVNQERAKEGLAALAWGSTCEAAAQTRATEIMTSYSHTRPDGTSWSTACEIPSTGGSSGENLMAGNAAVSPETVVEAWMNSETHRANILNPNFTKLAVGFVFDPNTKYKTYWSQYFSTY